MMRKSPFWTFSLPNLKAGSLLLFIKPTFSGIYLKMCTNLDLLITYYFVLIKFCSNWQIIDNKIKTLKVIWLKNEYLLKTINKCIKTFLDKIFINKDIVATVPKKEFNLILSF